LSSWYTRRELARRITSLYAALCIAMGTSGLIAAGVFSGLDGKMGLAGWQWLFIIEASTGVFFAFIGPFFIPDFPSSDKGAGKIWFTKEQREFAKERLMLDRVSEPAAKQTVWNGLRLVVTDLKTWIFVSSDLNFVLGDILIAFIVRSGSCHLMRFRFQQLLPLHRPRSWPRL